MSNLLHFLRHIIVVPLRLVDKAVRTIVNGLLVPLLLWYQDSQAGLRVSSVMRRGRWRVMMRACAMAPTSLLLVTGMVLSGIQIIRGRHFNVRILFVFL